MLHIYIHEQVLRLASTAFTTTRVAIHHLVVSCSAKDPCALWSQHTYIFAQVKE